MLPPDIGTTNESDLIGAAPTAMSLELGVVGWDEDDSADLGQNADGVTLVEVTLLRGGDPVVEFETGKVAGHRILARLSGFPFWAIPPRGMQVLVAFPGGFGETPGAGVIIGCPGPNPAVQFSKTRDKLDVGPEKDLVIKARSITLSTYDNRFLAIGPDTGTLMGDSDGTTVKIKDRTVSIMVPNEDGKAASMLILSLDSIQMVLAGAKIASLKLKDGNLTSIATQGSLNFGSTMIGVGASPATAAVRAPVGAPGTAGQGSASVFIAP